MKEILKILLRLILLLLVLGGVFQLGRMTYRPESATVEKRDTSSTLDTAIIPKPKPQDSTIIRYVYVKLPIVPASQDSVPAFQVSHQDSAAVEIPIERKVYAEDSLYRAVVSGYRVTLDSLTIYPTTTTITVYKTVESRKPGRWSLGITAGPSVLASPSGQFHAGVGFTAGLTYRF